VIRSVEIKGLRGIREGKLADLSPLVVLVGPNGSGKSTILDALLIAANPRPPDAIGQAAERREEVGLSASARWLLWKGGNNGPGEITVETDSGVRKCSLSITSSHSINFTAIGGKIRDQDASGKTTETEINLGFEAGQGPGVYGFFKPLDDVPEVRFLDPRVVGLRTPLHQLYTRVVEKGLHKEAIASLKTLIPGIEDIRILAEGDVPVVYLIFGGYAVPAALAGDGIRLLLHLTFELATRPGGLVLLEEPEVHMHPGAIWQSARAILAAVRRQIQVVLTTHSLELIDALVSECSDADLQLMSLYSLQLDGGILKFFRMAGPDVAFSRTQIQDDLR
jgi:energy-coupling factor transporter ATP-binding protein EcfA2